MTEPKYTLRDYGLLCERQFIDYSDCHKKSMLGANLSIDHKLRLPPLKKDYILKDNSIFFAGKRNSNASMTQSNQKNSNRNILDDNNVDLQRTNEKNAVVSSNMAYSETTKNQHQNSDLTNTLQFNLEGTHHFSQTDGQTPFQTGNLGKNYASSGNLTNTANWNYNSGQTKIPVNLASTNEAVNFLNTQHDLLDITNLAKRKSVRKYNPFAIKNRPSKYANVPIEVKKNKNLDNFLQGSLFKPNIQSQV